MFCLYPLITLTHTHTHTPGSTVPEVSRCSRLLSLATVMQHSPWDLVAMLSRVDNTPAFLQRVLSHYQTDYLSNASTAAKHLKRHYFTTCSLLYRYSGGRGEGQGRGGRGREEKREEGGRGREEERGEGREWVTQILDTPLYTQLLRGWSPYCAWIS